MDDNEGWRKSGSRRDIGVGVGKGLAARDEDEGVERRVEVGVGKGKGLRSSVPEGVANDCREGARDTDR